MGKVSANGRSKSKHLWVPRKLQTVYLVNKGIETYPDIKGQLLYG